MLIFTKGKSPLFSTGKDDWETPDHLFQEWHADQHFVVDAAANQYNHKVDRWYGPGGEHPNALTVPWDLSEGNIWLNPPYSKLQARFVVKAYQESLGKHYGVFCLLPARTDTRLFHEIIQPYSSAIHFLKGRVKFKAGGPLRKGHTQNSAPFPSMIVIF